VWSESLQPHTERSSRPGSEPSSVEVDVYVWCYALLVVHARKEVLLWKWQRKKLRKPAEPVLPGMWLLKLGGGDPHLCYVVQQSKPEMSGKIRHAQQSRLTCQHWQPICCAPLQHPWRTLLCQVKSCRWTHNQSQIWVDKNIQQSKNRVSPLHFWPTYLACKQLAWQTDDHLMASFSTTTWKAGTRKIKPICISIKQKMMGCCGISWTVCKSFAPHSIQITTPAPYHSIFYRPDALPDAQPTVLIHIWAFHTHNSFGRWQKFCCCQSSCVERLAIISAAGHELQPLQARTERTYVQATVDHCALWLICFRVP